MRTTRFPGRQAARLLRATLAVALAGSLLATTTPKVASATTAPTSRPNIVLILTDDQRWDTMWAMPQVRARLAAKGVKFVNGYVVNPLCCPSRTTILTGEYSHNTGVYTNIPGPHGAFPAFRPDDGSTVATWLHAGGYRTALIGKYLNGYEDAAKAGYVPPGWDRWVSFAEDNGAYYNYDLTINGRIRHYGSEPRDYSTRVLTGQATSFIRNTRGRLFMYFAVSAPHDPARPDPRDENAFPNLAKWRPPSYNELDVSDKPEWVQAHGLRSKDGAYGDDFRLDQYRTLLAVDRAVSRITEALRATGRLHNTLIVFTSDHGFLWGEHRWTGKEVPYEEAIRTPMIVRYDRLIPSGRTDDRLVLNMDLAPTFAAAGRVGAPGVDGRSFLPLLGPDGQSVSWRHSFMVEHGRGKPPIPSYCALHTEHSVYVRYATGAQEYYDLDKDPYQLRNLVRDPDLRARVVLMRTDLDRTCSPRPPGFSSETW